MKDTINAASKAKLGLAALLALAIALVASACGSSSDSEKLSLVAYSTPQEVYETVIPDFEKTSDGDGVGFTQSYGASGDQSRAVEAGQAADVVALSLAPDVDKLVEPGKVPEDWQKASKYDGFVSNSVVVFAVRKGNPKSIKTWDDLTKDGIEVIEPNPFTSGGAKWNIIAAYGAQLEQGKTKQQAVDYLEKLFDNVPVQDKSAREALQTFTGGKGDVLLAYENEAITAQQKGQDVDYVIPDETILIQNPIAATTDAKPQAQDFINYAQSEPAQKVFVEKGYRSVIPGLTPQDKYPTPSALFEITKLGGWSKVNDEFFTPEGIVGKIQQSNGVPTEK